MYPKGTPTFVGFTPRNVAPVFNVKDFGATGDGATDDRAAIQAALNACDAAGGGTVYLPTGTYAIATKNGADGTKHALEVHSSTRVTGAGIGATVVAVHDDLPIDTPVFYTNAANDIEFCHFSISGNKARLASGSIGTAEDEGIDIKGGRRINMHHLHIYEMGADAIDVDSLGGDEGDIQGSDLVIEDCGGIGWHASITQSRLTNFTIRNCGHERLANNSGQVAADACGADVKASSGLIANGLIDKCARGINVFNVNDVRITNVMIDMTGVTAGTGVVVGSNVEGGGGSDLQLLGVTVLNAAAAGVHIVKGSNILINGGRYVATGAALPYAVKVDTGTAVAIRNAYLQGSSNGDVLIASGVAAGWVIQGCQFVGATKGVRVESNANGGTVQGCARAASGEQAVDIRGPASGVKVLDNVFSGSGGVVRMLNSGGAPANCVVMGNVLTSITDTGTGHLYKNNVIGGAFVADGAS